MCYTVHRIIKVDKVVANQVVEVNGVSRHISDMWRVQIQSPSSGVCISELFVVIVI